MEVISLEKSTKRTKCFLICLLVSATVAKADDCTGEFTVLQHHQGQIVATTTINQSNGTVSYAQFNNLTYHPPTAFVGKLPTPASFVDQSKQLFNDRDLGQPFPANKADNLRIEIAQKSSGIVVTYTLLSWHDGKMGFTASCDGGIMHGYSNGAYYVVTFQLRPPIQ